MQKNIFFSTLSATQIQPLKFNWSILVVLLKDPTRTGLIYIAGISQVRFWVFENTVYQTTWFQKYKKRFPKYIIFALYYILLEHFTFYTNKNFYLSRNWNFELLKILQKYKNQIFLFVFYLPKLQEKTRKVKVALCATDYI